ncbi:MAG: hypothetical protein Q8922_15815 [Bacteroidota bacterium]|nr:hypothetical protein [Bacteroidota bacterium]MDP4232754.1 hypothetical protein [Bacteroidota bacterium]MDP4242564.1 hypothetical protein [Bacteroidota bacterium]MDP4289381.1 hypothetical protein [Bacteroidota bacterium]
MTTAKFFLVGLFILSVILNSCSSSNNSMPSPTPPPSKAALILGLSDSLPLAWIDSTGTIYAPWIDTVNHIFLGCSIRLATGDMMHIRDSAGLPRTAVVGKYYFLFSNYTNTSADIAWSDTAGNVGYTANADISVILSLVKNRSDTLPTGITTGKSQISLSSTSARSVSIGDALNVASLATCLASAVTACTTGIGIPAAILGCTPTAILLYNKWKGNEASLGQTLSGDAATAIAQLIGCASNKSGVVDPNCYKLINTELKTAYDIAAPSLKNPPTTLQQTSQQGPWAEISATIDGQPGCPVSYSEFIPGLAANQQFVFGVNLSSYPRCYGNFDIAATLKMPSVGDACSKNNFLDTTENVIFSWSIAGGTFGPGTVHIILKQ